MAKYCYCCGKKVKWIDYDLADGKICDECFELAKKKNEKISCMNINKYKGDYIKTLILGENTENLEQRNKSKTEKMEEKCMNVMSVAVKIAIGFVVLTIILSANEFLDDFKQGNTNNNKTVQESRTIEQRNLSPDEYISKFKNGKPKNASETVDELFRRNYGTPRYKYEEENGEKYVLVRADSTSRCETVTFYFRITGNEFAPVKCILRDQVQFKDNYLGEESARLILNTIFKNN